MKRPYPQWIDHYRRSVIRFLGNVDLRTFAPFDCFHFHPLHSDLWLEHLHRALVRFRQSGRPLTEAVETFPNPSSVRAMLMFMVLHYHNLVLDRQPVDRKQVQALFDFFIRVLRHKARRDLFAYRSSIGHDPEAVIALLNTVPWQRGTPAISHTLGVLYLGASSLVNGLMNDWVTDNGIEVWGPYRASPRFGRGTILAIREFPRLRPVELWPHTRRYRYRHVTIYTVYRHVQMSVEFVGCHTMFHGNLARNLLAWAVTIDGRWVDDPREVKGIAEYLLTLSERQYRRVRSMDFEALKQKALEQECYQLKDFFRLVGMDFRPTTLLRERVRQRPLLRDRYPLVTGKLTPSQIDHYFGIADLRELYRP